MSLLKNFIGTVSGRENLNHWRWPGWWGQGQLGVAVEVALEGWERSDGVGRWNSWYEFEIQ